jgi:hypothetical protein
MNATSLGRENQAWQRFRDEALLDGGEKPEHRKDGPETQAQYGATPKNSTGQPRHIQRGNGFSKYFDLGANKLMNSKLFCVNTHLLNLILRDSSYGGRYYGTTGLIAKEMAMDEENVRKRIAAMEDDDLLMRMQSENGSRWILLNPHYFCAGGQEDEDIAKKLWAREKAKRLKQARKRGP